ncbi:MAG: NAD(P)-binding protein [Myxococcaceae bacterium]
MERNLGTVEVAVVGGGLGGLACAALLGREGRTVAVLEAAHAGGRAQTHRKHGFAFNLGPHALYRGGPAEQVLRSLHVSFSGHVPVAAYNFALRQDVLHALPRSLGSALGTGLLSSGGKLELARLMLRILRADSRPLAGTSYARWVDEQAKHPEVRDLLLALGRVTSYSDAPERLSAAWALRQLKQALRRVDVAVEDQEELYLVGDWVGAEGMLSDASFASAREVARRLAWQSAQRRAG